MTGAPTVFEQRFLSALNHHLEGLKAKVERDFSESAYLKELNALRGDPVYERFGFDCGEYVLVRLIGRMSISVGRRLGEIYDKVPRFVAAARFNITADQVAEVFDGLELDISLRYSLLSPSDRAHITQLISPYTREKVAGVGIEIRYNFNPNDSSRLRKDVDVVSKLKAQNLFPVYLTFSSISPRDEAIARLKRAGWIFLQGEEALSFANNLFGVNIMSVLDKPEISKQVKAKTTAIMQSIFTSPAVKQLATADKELPATDR
jgi:hypothetical protein